MPGSTRTPAPNGHHRPEQGVETAGHELVARKTPEGHGFRLDRYVISSRVEGPFPFVGSVFHGQSLE